MALGSGPSEAVKTVPDFLLTKTRGPCLGGDIVMLSMGVGKIGTQGGLHIVPETAGAVPLNQVSHAHECLSFRVLANSWRSIDQLSIITYVPFDIWNRDPIRPLHRRWCENELSTGEIQPPEVPSATFKRPGLIPSLTCFCVNTETKGVRAIIDLGLTAHCMCLGLRFGVHNARRWTFYGFWCYDEYFHRRCEQWPKIGTL